MAGAGLEQALFPAKNGGVSARIKSLVVTPAIMSQVVLGLYALSVAVRSPVEGLGAAVTALAMPAYVGMMFRIRRPRISGAPLLVPTAAGVLLALTVQPTAPMIALALVSAAVNVLYVVWYSRFGRTPSPVLQVGQPLPAFSLQEVDGSALGSAALLGKPTVWLFYRGSWCPLCMVQIREIAAAYRELAARGAQVALISPQPHEQSRALAERFDVPLRFLVDADNTAATALQIVHRDGVPLGVPAEMGGPDTVLPTVILTDADGVVRMVDQTDNYRLRPEPATFLAALEAL